jgi:ATP-dependent DNA ligase
LIDGEVVACNEQRLAVFELLRRGDRIKNAAHLFAFDLLALMGVTSSVLRLKSARAVWPIS